MESVLKSGTGLVPLSGAAVLEVSCGLARLGHPLTDDTEPFDPKILNVPGSTLAGPWRIDVRTDPVDGALAIPQAAISGVLRVGLAQSGDRIRIRGHHKKLSDALVQARVPTWRRHGLLVITGSTGVIAVPSEPTLSPPPGDPEDSIYHTITKR
jgi:tRNA(Ile)-lysidine synthetase-like protein